MERSSESTVLFRLDKLLTRLNRWCVAVMMGIMFVLVFANVVTRYCFQFSIAVAEEISTFLMIWVTYLGAGLALREGKLASIEALQDRLTPSLLRTVRILLGMITMVFFGLLVFYGVRLVALGWSQQTFALMIPRGIPYLVLPVGAVLFSLHLVLFFKRWTLRQWEKPSPQKDSGSIQGEQT